MKEYSSHSLKDKVIVVTGGTGVLGNSFVNAIAEAGGAVCILGRNEQTGIERSEKIISSGGKAMALKADVLDVDQLKEARREILHEFGKIDGLVNAAGGIQPQGVLMPGQDIFEMNIEEMRRNTDLNLWGTIIPTQVFGKAIADTSDNGSIVNISSMNSKRAITRVLGYNLGKAGVDCFTQWYAVELANRYGDSIRMNALAPGFFLTEQNRRLLVNEDGSYTQRGQLIINQTPFKRFGEPDELKGALTWLLSDQSRFVTGAMICVDGGFSAFGGV
ncbi:MAG: SDR family oxidoreductase [Chitinophagaceae bacterium]|nr:SDR family oxidoreductase [Chitinophagaceae bacterium]